MEFDQLDTWLLVGLVVALGSWIGFVLTPVGSIPDPDGSASLDGAPSPGVQLMKDLQSRNLFSPGVFIVLTLLVGSFYFHTRRKHPDNYKPDRLAELKLEGRELSGLLLWLIASIGISAWTSNISSNVFSSRFYFFLASTISLQLTLLLASFLLLNIRSVTPTDLFPSAKEVFRKLTLGWKLYLMVYPLILLTVLVNNLIQKFMQVEPSPPAGIQFYESATNSVEMLILVGMIVLVAPVAEELFFRGLVYQNLKTWFSANHSALLSGGLFALVHFQPHTVFPLWVLGIIFALTYERTGSFWVVVSMHSFQNLLSLLIIGSL